MTQTDYDLLQNSKTNNKEDISIFHIIMNCDHKYPNGETAIENLLWVNNCKICDRMFNVVK